VDKLYPVRRKNLDTGRYAFRISESGNRKVDGKEVEEAEMIEKVLKDGYAVRMTTLERSIAASLYKRNGRSIIDQGVEKVGVG
jgi:hypothetical protein